MFKFSFFCMFLVSNFLFAQEVVPNPKPAEPTTWEKVKEKTGEVYDYSQEKAGEAYEFGKEKAQQVQSSLAAARDNRGSTKWSITGNYSVFEMWVLNKYGVTFAYNADPSITYEFEYMKGSIGFGSFGVDIGEIKEQRFSVLRRSFGERKTLNFLMGAFYNKFDISLGDDLLASFTGNKRNQLDLLEIETAGFTWGIGNRWQTKKGYVWGFDWFVVNLPLTTIKEKAPYLDDSSTSENDRDEVRDALHFFERFPSVGVVKIQLGFSF